MSQFNSVNIKKDETSRNDINHRMQNFNNFFLPEDNQIPMKGDDLLGNHQNNKNRDNSVDKSMFKDQINSRIDTFSRNQAIDQRKLPFHNNIRDYNITMDSKKDEFNNRLSNYNYLSSNIPPQIHNKHSEQFNQISFHKSFKEDTNQRLQDLSPLSRNLGLPSNGTEAPALPDFNQNLPQENMDPTYAQYDYKSQFTNNQESKLEQENYAKNYESMNPYQDSQTINYNSYDSSNFGAYIPDNSKPNYAQSENKLYTQSQKTPETIQNFDYSLIDNQGQKNNYHANNGKDGINRLPQLAYNTNMPVDTRQDFHFHQNFN